jgi:hypothetical protein
VLDRLQGGLERMYRIDTRLRIQDFVIDDQARQRLGLARMPREQLLLSQDEDTLEVGVFVDDAVLRNLAQHDPGRQLHEGNFGDFLLALEGVSHFVYLMWCTLERRPVSALELELQAEIDKYVTCLLMVGTEPGRSGVLRRRLFEQFVLEDDLDAAERDRYRAANANAHRYSVSLEQRYVRSRRIVDMLGELRRFYRMSLPAKLDFIAGAA